MFVKDEVMIVQLNLFVQVMLLQKTCLSSNICSNKPVCLNNICISKPTLTITVSPSKPACPIIVCPSKPIHPSYVYSKKPVCPSNVCQSKLISPTDVCLQNPWFLIKTLIFNLFLVIQFFSTCFKLSIFTLNIFINLILLKVIFLTNFTCLKKRLILFISLNGSYLDSLLDAVIIFQSSRTILKISPTDAFSHSFHIFLRYLISSS